MKFNRYHLVFMIMSAILIALNANVFIISAPHTTITEVVKSTGYKMATAWSAFISGADRLVNAPNHIYAWGNCGGTCANDYPLYANAQDYRYAPFFLVIVAPFLLIPSYAEQIAIWNAINFTFLPLMAFLIWQILKPKNWLQTGLANGVALFVLFEPINITNNNILTANLANTCWGHGFGVANNWLPVSSSYCAEWFSGQSKVFELLMIFLAVYFFTKSSMFIGGFFLSMSSLDPRFTLMILPLVFYIFVKSKKLESGLIGILFGVCVLYIPFLFYRGVLYSYTSTIFRQYNVGTFYQYEWIPFFGILALMIAYFIIEILNHNKASARATRAASDDLQN